jgi:immune inhibitor A
MKRWIVLPLVTVVLSLVALVAIEPPAGSSSSVGSSSRGFSATPLRPEALAALRARGKQVNLPFPNSINRGRKFNPGGETVPPLQTAAEQNVLVIFIDFQDSPPHGPVVRLDLEKYFDAMLFGTTYDVVPGAPPDRTLKNYYQAVSYGKVNVVTVNLPSELGWKTATQAYDYYCKADGIHDNGFGPYPNNAQGLVREAVKQLGSNFDFSPYAVNGELPNLFVVHAGTGAEWSGDPSVLWSHSWSLSDGTDMPDGLVVNGVTINNYAMMPEVGGDLTGYAGTPDPPFPPTVGVFAHEYGHVLGLPDQYDYGYESDGTGIYSLMAGGSWNTWPRVAMLSGNSPAFLDAWSRYRLGFVTPQETTGAVTLPAAETSPAVFKMVVPNSGGKEYFLLENRQHIGFDEGLNVYEDESVHGLAIYHVDDVVMSRNYWRPNEAENWKKFRSEGSQKSWTGETHYGISLIQADDRWDLEKAIYGGFMNDLYPGVGGLRTSFGTTTLPNSSSYYFWAGSAPKFGYSGVTVSDIVEENGVIRAKLSYVPVK